MAQPWYDYPITEPHSSDDGVDLGTPDRTPVFMPFGGKVIDTSYHDYGGQVVVDVPGTGASEYFIHLNDISVQPGQELSPGALIGDTGGGVGDLVLHDGRVQPAQSQSWYDGHSTGYHTEYGIFEGDDMAQFNEGWGNKSRQLDPTGVLDALRAGQTPQWPGPSQPNADTTAQLSDPLTGGIPGWLGPVATGGVLQEIEKSLAASGFSSWGNTLQRLTVGAVGIAAILLGLGMVLVPEGEKAQTALSDKAERALGVVLGSRETSAAVKPVKAASAAKAAAAAAGGAKSGSAKT